MGTVEHYHPHLTIYVDGSAVPIPPNIGVDPSSGGMSALHTHEGDGTIHVEADAKDEAFTLGQLFVQWGVTLSRTQIGGVSARSGQVVRVASNGVEVQGDPSEVRLEPNQEIVLSVP